MNKIYRLKVKDITPEPNVSIVELEPKDFYSFLSKQSGGIIYYNDEMESFFTENVYYWVRK